jgi:hypothetical protein
VSDDKTQYLPKVEIPPYAPGPGQREGALEELRRQIRSSTTLEDFFEKEEIPKNRDVQFAIIIIAALVALVAVCAILGEVVVRIVLGIAT